MFGNLIERMLSVEETVEVQVSIAVAFAGFWTIFFELCFYILVPWIQKQSWYRHMLSILEYQYNNFGLKQGADQSREDWEYYLATGFANCQIATVQHFVGGCMALPMVLGLDTFNLTGLHSYQWAMLGGLCELGWEYYDNLRMYFKNDPALVFVICALHHSLAHLVVIPCNLYMVCWGYAAQIVNLQFIAAIALALTSYSKTLDLENPKQAIVIAKCFVVYTAQAICCRGFFYVYFAYLVIVDLIAHEYWVMLAGALIGATCMFVFNLMVIFDCIQCTNKYCKLAFGDLKGEEKKELVRQITEEMGTKTTEETQKLIKQMTGTGRELVKQLTGSGSGLVRQLTGGFVKQQM